MRVCELEPKAVFHFFEEISQIPRPSYHEKQISDYLAEFAKKRGLFFVQDEIYNIIIVKEASEGYENQPAIILQGHMDMVCEKEAGCEKNMELEGLDLQTDGKHVRAKGTTLGGDDGIALAYALAILDADDIPHPRLEFVCTVCEEVGMDGAAALDVSSLRGKRLLNLDSEEEGIFLAGCAGGCTADIRMTVKDEMMWGLTMDLEISGLLGGHSGTEIDKHRANANMLMLEWLGRIYDIHPFACVKMEGGSKDNAIPRSCICRIAVPESTSDMEYFWAAAQKIAEEIEADWKQAEPGICLKVQGCENKEIADARELFLEHSCLGIEQTGTLLKKISVFPNGVISMCQEPAGLVETSLNLGILRIREEEIQLRYSVRSCVDQQLEFLIGQLGGLTKRIGAVMEISGKYPAWEYRKHSAFRDGLVCVYQDMFKKTPQIEVIHAGVECGILATKIPGLECVSMGPDIFDIHTPAERMDVASVRRTYEFIKEVLRQKDSGKECV